MTVVGRARAVIDAYTPPGARYSLLAWLPADCAPRAGCPVEITNTPSAEPLVTGAGPGHRPGPDINYTTAVIGGR